MGKKILMCKIFNISGCFSLFICFSISQFRDPEYIFYDVFDAKMNVYR